MNNIFDVQRMTLGLYKKLRITQQIYFQLDFASFQKNIFLAAYLQICAERMLWGSV